MLNLAALDDAGFAEVPGVLTPERCADVARVLDGTGGRRPGTRNLLDLRCCQDLAATLRAHASIGPLLPPAAVAVQCTLFDKSVETNWLVALHQDLSIPVREKVAHPECNGWSEKEGILYAQRPVRLLQSLVAVRAHLDDCGPESGPLRVVPRSHRHGRLSVDEAETLRQQNGEAACIARRGDVVAMRPLLLHSSSKMRSGSRRRVLHFLFGPAELPCGLRWHRAV